MPRGPETWGNLETWGQTRSSPRSQVGWPRVSTQTLRAHKRFSCGLLPENALVARFLAFLPSGKLPAPCFPGPEARQRPDRTAAVASHAFGVDESLHTLSLQQWVNAEGGGISLHRLAAFRCTEWGNWLYSAFPIRCFDTPSSAPVPNSIFRTGRCLMIRANAL
jgi:hypothetical protein